MTRTHSESSNVPVRNFRSPWVIAFIVMAIIVFSVNILFIVASSISNPGLVTESYAKYGLQQHRMDELVRKQSQRGWQIELGFPERMRLNTETPIYLTVRDRQGLAVADARAEVVFFRPSDATQDLRFEFHAPLSPSEAYQTRVKLPTGGTWDVNVLIERGSEKHVLNQRLVVDVDHETAHARTWLDRIVSWAAPPSSEHGGTVKQP